MHTLLKSKHNLCESYLINTLMVSKGCPATTVHTPPNPPDRKYFIGFTGFFSDIFIEYSQRPHDTVNPLTHTTTEWLCSTQIRDHWPSSTVHECLSGHLTVSGYFSEREGAAQRFSKAKWFNYRRGVIRNTLM